MIRFDLGGGYHAQAISVAEYQAACARLEDRIFGGNWLYDFGPAAKAPPPLGESFTFGLYHGAEPIGWHHSRQLGERTVYMADTGILPEHQGRGLYTRLLPHLIATFHAAGYTLVQSHHRATNNRVIVPKLRAGFFLQGLNLYEGGLNAALTLSLDDAYRGAQHVRSGHAQAQGETARRLGVEALEPSAVSRQPSGMALPDVEGPGVDLGDGYSLYRVPHEIYREVSGALEGAAFQTVSYDWGAAPALPQPDFRRYAWLIGRGGLVAGWHSSRQWDARGAYMSNTALLPAHRGRGVYTRLLPAVLDVLRAEGYAVVRSHHHATNNAVLIPKLRAGFRFQGMEVTHRGVMAVLLHSFDDGYRDYMDVRSGLKKPQGEVARRLGLKG